MMLLALCATVPTTAAVGRPLKECPMRSNFLPFCRFLSGMRERVASKSPSRGSNPPAPARQSGFQRISFSSGRKARQWRAF
jgi:hypothetical protein